MKKVMIASAIALAGVAFADTPCVIGPSPVVTNAAVYAWKFTGKTTVGTLLRTRVVTSGSNCALGSTTNITCAIRIPGSLAIQGYTYYCDNCCDSFESGTSGATLAEFYMTKPFRSKLDAPTITMKVAHIIGRQPTQYEAEGEAQFTSADPSETWKLTFAGFGSFNRTLKVPTSISGNFAGTLSSPYYVGNGVCAQADYWDCATLLPAGRADADGIAYGTWSVKYNASASRAYRARGATIALPSWAR